MADYVIVLDPGHGSDQYHGGEFGPYVEKDIDLAVALTIKDHLEKYEGVKVYLTRYDDRVVELKERADIAKAYNADYFISVHFNMSAAHDLYGSEVWLPVQNKYYNAMYPMANEFMNTFRSMGLFDRGIKTRLSSSGKDNYYAVLKYATNYGIPSCIVEHCHMDNINDTKLLPVVNQATYSAALTNFGIQDAEAIAKTLKLKSQILGTDYSNYKTVKGNAKAALIKMDETAPEVNKVELVSKDTQANTVTIKLTAKDKNSYLLYYKYSIDGGITFSEALEWPSNGLHNSKESFTTTINVPANKELNIVTMVYNSYDVTTLSNVLNVPALGNVNVSSLNELPINTKEDNVSILIAEHDNDILASGEGMLMEVKSLPKATKVNSGLLIDSLLTGGIIVGLLIKIFINKHKL